MIHGFSRFALVLIILVPGTFAGCQETGSGKPVAEVSGKNAVNSVERPEKDGESDIKTDEGKGDEKKMETVTLGAGCFWCVEAVFDQLEGVSSVESGYMGGQIKNPTYKQVCTGLTGHAEVCRITFDPEVCSFEQLLEVFWKTHDPTTLNRQGADEGTQYRSAIFFSTDEQRVLAEEYKEKLDASGAFEYPIVTEIVPAVEFYVAEDYHQQYFELNGNEFYCQRVIAPKMEKFKAVFGDRMKKPVGKDQ